VQRAANPDHGGHYGRTRTAPSSRNTSTCRASRAVSRRARR
jgi:hypothetical protein